MKSVPRVGRVLDLVGLLLFLGGGGVFARAWVGFRGVPAYHAAPEEGAFATMRLADGYLRLQRIGVGVMLAGVAVFGLAWWIARRAGRQAT